MKYTRFILIGLMLLFLLFVMTRNKQDPSPQQQVNESRFETQSDEQGRSRSK